MSDRDDEIFDPFEPLTEVELASLEAIEATRPGQDAYTVPSLIQRLIAEVRRLRAAEWIDAAAEEIAGDPSCCDISSSSSSEMAEIIRKHLKEPRG
jgi:hypothetical protein